MQEKQPANPESSPGAFARGTDRLSTAERSALMAKVKSSGTKPEEKVCKALFQAGFRYRKNVVKLPGKPDIVLAKYKAAVFVHGCFWHRHENCPEAILPQSRQEYWTPKLRRNAERDRSNAERLTQAGWRVFIVWECELRPRRFQATLDALINSLRETAKPLA
jgi:DNA mismatch endonuclease (patch repair protein)